MLDDTAIENDSLVCEETVNTGFSRDSFWIPALVVVVVVGDIFWWDSPYKYFIQLYCLPLAEMSVCLLYLLLRTLQGRIKPTSLGTLIAMFIVPHLSWAVLVYQESEKMWYRHILAFVLWYLMLMHTIGFSDYLFGQWVEHKYQLGMPEEILGIFFTWALPLNYLCLYSIGIAKKFRQSRLASQSA